MNKFKRTLALFLVLCTVMSVVPFSVLAADGAEVSTEQTEAASEETTIPTEETAAPTEETAATEQTAAPTEETVIPTEETASTEETAAPTEETAAPTEETADPTEETAAPAEEDPTDPSDETTPVEEEIATMAITMGQKPQDGTTPAQPFAAGTGGSQNFRIPGIVTLANGTLIASCDARWNQTGDGAGLDTIVSYSTDNGANWHYTLANYLGDNGNVKNVYSTSFIDPAIATDGTTAYMIADLFPAAIALNTSKHSPVAGKNGLDENGNLMLRNTNLNVEAWDYSNKAANAPYNFYLNAAEGKIYNYDGTVVEGYAVDAHFNITGNGVDTNLFCADSPYQPYPTNYLYLTTSTDGKNWSAPQLLNLKEANEQTLLVGPGNGTYDAKNDRLIFTAYEHSGSTERSALIWKDSSGQWHRSADATNNQRSSEATAVVLADGTVRCFYRGDSSQLQYTDYTWDAQKNNYVPSKMEQTFNVTRTPNNQMSAIKYSKQVGGKDLILLSTAATTSTTRLDGHIYALTVNADNSMELLKSYDVVPGQSEVYNYSCLTEMDNGNIALLYEDVCNSSSSSIVYKTIAIEDIVGEVFTQTVTDEATGVSVTAPNLTTISVEKLAESTPAAGYDKSVSYRITLNGGAYTGKATVKIPVDELADCRSYIGHVGEDAFEVPAPVDGFFTVTVPHFSVVTISGNTQASKTENVVLEVGETTTRTELSGSYNGSQNDAIADISWAGYSDSEISVQAQPLNNGPQVPLTDCLYKFSGNGTFTIESVAKPGTYLNVKDGNPGYPQQASGKEFGLRPGAVDGTYYLFHTYQAGWFSPKMDCYLHFHHDGKNVFDRVESKSGTIGSQFEKACSFYLYRPAAEGDTSSTEIPGFVRVTGEVQAGTYLIAAEVNGTYYLLYPSTSTSNKYDHVAQVVKTENAIAATKVTFVGKSAGNTTVTVGDTKYMVTVKNKQVAVSLPVNGQQVFDCNGTITTQPDSKIATAVVADGKLTITGVAEGTTKMVAGGVEYTITVQNQLTLENTPFLAGTGVGVNVEDKDHKYHVGPVTKLTISEDLTYDLNLDPKFDGQNVQWSVENDQIASVDQDGHVTGKSAGETHVIATIDGVAYRIPVVVKAAPNAVETRIYDFYASEITDTKVSYIWNNDTKLIELIEGEAIYVSQDKNGDNCVNFFGAPNPGYALTRMSSTNSDGAYFILHNGDHKTINIGKTGFVNGTCEVAGETMNGAGINQHEVWGDRPGSPLYNSVQAAIDAGCDGGMGFTRLKKSDGTHCTLTFRSEKLPTVAKEVRGVLGTDDKTYREYKEGMTVVKDETVFFKVTVDKYASQDEIAYANVKLKDLLPNAQFIEVDSSTKDYKLIGNTLDLTKEITAAGKNAEQYTYYAVYKITDADLDTTIHNTVELKYNYKSKYSSGAFDAEANAEAKITATAFKPQDIVIDFGLPVTVRYDQWGKNVQLQPKGNAKYGEVAVVSTTDGGWDVTYTPTQILQGVDTVTLTAEDFATKAATEYTFNVYPATTVYYEDNFASSDGGFTPSGQSNAGKQEMQLAGEANKNAFGYDDAYNAVGMSNGTEIISNKVNNTTDFTFTGTGIEIYANCAIDTGIASITIRDAQTNKLHKFYQVDTRTKKGTTGATEQQEMESNSLPIVSVRDLPWGKYKVTIIHTQRSAEGLGGNIRLDGYRVFNTLNDPELENAAYPESEKNPHYEELRDWVLNALKVDDTTDSIYNEAGSIIDQVYNANGTTNGAVVLAQDGVYTQDNMKDLLDNGPKNELFLYPGQAVTFNLKADNAQIGLKAVNGTVSYKLNNVVQTNINTSTDMFYHNLSKGPVTIQNTSFKNVLSITLLKCFGASASVFGEITQDQMADALRTLGCEEPIVRADASLKVSLVDNTGAEVASTVLTANGIAGEVNSFTAEQILAAAREQMPVKYAFADEQSVKGAEVVFGEEGTVTVKVGKTATLNVTYVKRELKRVGFFRFKMVETVVETKSFTGVKTSAGRYYRVSAKQIRDAAPDGTFVLSGATSKRVPFGSEVNMKVIVK